MSGAVPGRDAEPAEFPALRYPRLLPRHSPIWIHVAGAWRRGHVLRWIRVDGRWLAWADHDNPDGYAWPTHGMYVYNPATIRPRHGGEPPG